MWKKIILGILIIEIIISWPISLIKKPAKINWQTIFYSVSSDEEWTFQKELALDTSVVKKIYLNKTTIIKDRYLKNLLVLVDPNNYFFAMHPREDVSGVDYRFKYPFWAILFLIPGIGVTLENKKYRKLWWVMLGEILMLSFLKQMDGLDIILFFPITYLLYLGVKKVSKYKYSWVLFIVLIILMAIEIGRICL